MKLTYLIGNGFDIALGLNTRYSDFVGFLINDLQEYLHPAMPGVTELDFKNASWLLNQIKEHRQEFWSDAELAFGALPFKQEWANVEDVVRFSHQRFQSGMKKWLAKELKRINLAKSELEDLSSMFIINCVTGWFPGATRGQISRFLPKDENRDADNAAIELNFVTFNYTDIIERLIDTRRGDIFNFKHYNRGISVMMGDVCHVHGVCLQESLANTLIFGVNDANQITDPNAKDNVEVMARIIKQEYQGYADTGRMEVAREIISNSDYIITYGLSFGATDKIWWDTLLEFVRDSSKRLIVCPYMTKDDSVLSLDLIRYKQMMARKVFASLGDHKLREVMSAKIIPQIIDVKPVDIEESSGRRRFCDYLRLDSVGQAMRLHI